MDLLTEIKGPYGASVFFKYSAREIWVEPGFELVDRGLLCFVLAGIKTSLSAIRFCESIAYDFVS